VALIVRCKISYVCDPDALMLQRDGGRTDDMQSQYRALDYSASRGVKGRV